jgi:hypothetical protein
MRLGLLVLMFAATSLAAGPTATVTGRVTDLSGGLITGVKVEATNVVFPGETNGEGLYNIPNLPLGTYRVIVSKFAFRTIFKPGVELHVQDVISLNFSMEVGSVAESITVERGAPLIQSTPARGGNFMSNEALSASGGDESLSLARTLPGAIEPAGSWQWASVGPWAGFSLNGQRMPGNNYLLDSTENNDFT